MKNYRTAFIFLLMAFILSAYSYHSKIEKKQTKYIWFLLKPSVSIACNNYTTVTPSVLILFERKFGFSTPVADMIDYHLTVADAVEFIGCPVNEVYVCAVGYAASDSNFEAVTIDGIIYWRPKATVNELVKICKPYT